jgi:hypothetical protein
MYEALRILSYDLLSGRLHQLLPAPFITPVLYLHNRQASGMNGSHIYNALSMAHFPVIFSPISFKFFVKSIFKHFNFLIGNYKKANLSNPDIFNDKIIDPYDKMCSN